MPQEWDACLDIWTAGVQLRLTLTDSQLSKISSDALGIDFLTQYCTQNADSKTVTRTNAKELRLRRLCRTLLSRISNSCVSTLAPSLLAEVLGCGSYAFARSELWRKSLHNTWNANAKSCRKAIESAKLQLEISVSPVTQSQWLQKLSALTRALPEIATITVAGADYLDTLTNLYNGGSSEVQRAVV